MESKFLTQMQTVLDKAIDSCDGSISELARRLQTNKAKISKWNNGISLPNLESAAQLADMVGAHIVFPDEKLADYDFIPKIAAKAGAGALSLETDGYEVARYAFRKDFLGMKGISSKNAVLLDVTGDSMRPLLSPGDTVLIDLANKTIVDGGIYLVTLYENLLIKQVVLAPNHIILHSLNAPDIPVQPHEMDSFQLHGRMRWAARMFD